MPLGATGSAETLLLQVQVYLARHLQVCPAQRLLVCLALRAPLAPVTVLLKFPPRAGLLLL